MRARWYFGFILISSCAASVDMGSACPPGMPSCAPSGGTGGASGSSGLGGSGGGAGGAAVDGGNVNDHLTALIHEQPSGLAVTMVTISCSGDCAQVIAVATGGNPGYTFTWNDGVMTAAREVCAIDTTTFSVTVTDTAIEGSEFQYVAQMASAKVTATVLDCPADGGTSSPDAGVNPPDGGTWDECGPGDRGWKALQTLRPDIFGTPTYFAGGAALPAGRYRLTYVDGCLRYQGGGFEGTFDDWDWTVQGLPTYNFLIIGETTAQTLGMPPSVTAQFGLSATFPVFDDCVNANLASTPLEFNFAGGKLGIWQNDTKPEDNVAGPNGRSPTWELSRDCG